MEVLTLDDQLVTIPDTIREKYDYFSLANEMSSMTLDSERMRLPITLEEYEKVMALEVFTEEDPMKWDLSSLQPTRMSDMRRIMALMSPVDEKWRLGVILDEDNDEDYLLLGRVVDQPTTIAVEYKDERPLTLNGLPPTRMGIAMPYISNVTRGIHMNFGTYNAHTISSKRTDEVLPYILAVLHSGFLLSLEAGDYVQGEEVPWYHLNWRVLSRHTSQYFMPQSQRDGGIGVRSFLIDAMADRLHSWRHYTVNRDTSVTFSYVEGVMDISFIPRLNDLLSILINTTQAAFDPLIRPTHLGVSEVLGYEDIMETNHEFLTKRELYAHQGRRESIPAEQLLGRLVSLIIKSNPDDYIRKIYDSLGSSGLLLLINSMYRWSQVLYRQSHVEESIDAGQPDWDEVVALRDDLREPLPWDEYLEYEELPTPTPEEDVEFREDDAEYNATLTFVESALSVIEE